jgi:hypothetical protein
VGGETLSVCNDCGQGFKGEVKEHYAAAHDGMPRFRFRDAAGVSHLVCAACGYDVEEGSAKHLKSAGGLVPGKSSDPIDLFANHQMSHGGD